MYYLKNRNSVNDKNVSTIMIQLLITNNNISMQQFSKKQIQLRTVKFILNATTLVHNDEFFKFTKVTEKGYQFVNSKGKRYVQTLMYASKNTSQLTIDGLSSDQISVVLPAKVAEIIRSKVFNYDVLVKKQSQNID